MHCRRKTFIRTFLIQGSNPKLLLYFVAVLPQFVCVDAPLMPQLAMLSVLTLAFDVLAYSAYGMLGVALARLSVGRLAAQRPGA